MTGYYNRQNERYWVKENPSKRITIWCALPNKGIIPFIMRDETVNSQNHLQKSFVPKLRRMGILKTSWFMQDGARPHTANIVLAYLKRTFGEKIFSSRYPEVCDMGLYGLATSQIFLWG